MDDALQQLWEITTTGDDLGEHDRLLACREVWEEHREPAALRALGIGAICLGKISTFEQKQPQPARPTPRLASALGLDFQRAMDGGRETWNVIANLQLTAVIGVADPFVPDQHHEVVREFQGEAVFWYTWWAYGFLVSFVQRHEDRFEEMYDSIVEDLEASSFGSLA